MQILDRVPGGGVIFFSAFFKIKLVLGTKFGVGCVYFSFYANFQLVSGTNLDTFSEVPYPAPHNIQHLITTGTDRKDQRSTSRAGYVVVGWVILG